MVNQIYNQLKTPKTLEVLHQRLNEIGLEWNKAQIELFLNMDKSIMKDGDAYSYNIADTKDIILDIIDKAIGTKPMIPIIKIIDSVPIDFVVSAEDILKIALESGKYQSPNGSVLKKGN